MIKTLMIICFSNINIIFVNGDPNYVIYFSDEMNAFCAVTKLTVTMLTLIKRILSQTYDLA